MSAALFSSPSTPTAHRNALSWNTAPLLSSPLASSPPSSPSSAAQERHSHHREQYAATPTKPRHRTSIKLASLSSGSRRQSNTHTRYGSSTQTADDPQKAFLRERFRARCLDRAAQDRERKIKGKRPMLSEPSSDMECEDDDNEDDDEAVLNDELFRRIMASVESKRKYSYRLSYSHDVGSSYDPSIEEEIEWENQLKENQDDAPQSAIPDELDEEALAEWAAEQELIEGLDPDEIFSLSDLDEEPEVTVRGPVAPSDDEEILWRSVDKGKQRAYASVDDDVEMDL